MTAISTGNFYQYLPTRMALVLYPYSPHPEEMLCSMVISDKLMQRKVIFIRNQPTIVTMKMPKLVNYNITVNIDACLCSNRPDTNIHDENVVLVAVPNEFKMGVTRVTTEMTRRAVHDFHMQVEYIKITFSEVQQQLPHNGILESREQILPLSNSRSVAVNESGRIFSRSFTQQIKSRPEIRTSQDLQAICAVSFLWVVIIMIVAIIYSSSNKTKRLRSRMKI